jgi:hypothetical protein
MLFFGIGLRVGFLKEVKKRYCSQVHMADLTTSNRFAKTLFESQIRYSDSLLQSGRVLKIIFVKYA